MADDPAVRAVLAKLRQSRKYGSMAEEALRRTAAGALQRNPHPQAAGKIARRKLHQVSGAYVSQTRLAKAELAAERLDAGELDVRVACQAVLAAHASTRERLGFAEDLFAAAFDGLAGVDRVTDLGCGLNPFAIPWMPLAAGSGYVALDVDARLATLCRRLAPHVEVDLRASARDLIASREPIESDVVLLLKVLHNLEQQEPGAAARLCERISARRLVVSVPTQSLGSRHGLRAGSLRLARRVLGDRMEAATQVDFPSETLIVLPG